MGLDSMGYTCLDTMATSPAFVPRWSLMSDFEPHKLSVRQSKTSARLYANALQEISFIHNSRHTCSIEIYSKLQDTAMVSGKDNQILKTPLKPYDEFGRQQ